MISAQHQWQRAVVGQTKAIRFGPIRYQDKVQNLTGATVVLAALRGGLPYGINYDLPYALDGLGAVQGGLSLENEACVVPTQTTAKGYVDWSPGLTDLDGLAGEVVVQLKITEAGGAIYYWPERLGTVGIDISPVFVATS